MIDRAMDPPPGPTTAQRAILADQVSARLGWLGVGFGAGPWPSLPELWSTADITDAQRAGLDPTLRWREGLTAAAARTYGAAPPPAYAATFVLQWLAQLIAYPAAHVAALSPWVLDCSAAPVRFELDPVWWSPRRVVFAADALRPEPVADRRWSRTEAAFSDLAARLALGYAPGVKMSSRQRLGSVRDMWRAACREAGGPPHAGGADWRESCCFIFVLPGASECAACPRLRGLGRRRPGRDPDLA